MTVTATRMDGSLLAGLGDAALAERCLARDEDAVRELTRRYNQRLYRIARGILRSDADAEDAVQDAYIKALGSLDRFRGDAALGTWLTRITINEALGRLRRRREPVPDTGAESSAHDALDAHAATTPDPETLMATLESRVLIEDAIDELPDSFRSVFIARMVEGLSVEETADLFGMRPQTVKTRVHRARAKLRANLQKKLGPRVQEAFAFDGARCDRLTQAVVARFCPAGTFPPSPTSN